MLHFHSKTIKPKFFSTFTEEIYKSMEDISISSLVYKIDEGSKLDEKMLICQ